MKQIPTTGIAIGAVIISIIAIFSSLTITPTSKISPGDIGTAELEDNSVTGDKISNKTITDIDITTDGISKIGENSVGSSQIDDNSILLKDLSSSLSAAITGVQEIADNSITSAKIKDETITKTDIATGAIESDEIANNAVGSNEIATDAVESSEILDGTITTTDLSTTVSDRLGKVATVTVAADGSEDYTDIQNAIDSLPSAGGAVYIREGTYTVSSAITVPSNTALIGTGSSTRIHLANGANTEVIQTSGERNIILANLRINGNRANQTAIRHGIRLNDTNTVAIRSCGVEAVYGSGIYLDNSSYIDITDSAIVTNKAAGVVLHNSSDVVIKGSFLHGNGTVGIYIYQSSKNVVTGNICDTNDMHGIMLETNVDSNVVTSNVLESNGQGGAWDGIYVSDGDFNVITGNRSTGSTQRWGVNINSGNKNLVSSNVLTGNGTGGLRDAGINTVKGNNVT